LSDDNLEVNNPLSSSENNPWQQSFQDNALREVIDTDVKRIFTDIDIFKERVAKVEIANVLFIWSKMNPNISYRQGMHEIAGIVYLVIRRDLEDWMTSRISSGDDIPNLFEEKFVEHDVWAIFAKIMIYLKQYYELSGSVSGTRPETPLLISCNRVIASLRKIDASLCEHLLQLGIEPQLYCLRWFRLLFSREFSMLQTLLIWDRIFAYGENFLLVEWIAVSMLQFLREPSNLR
jgi:TBC1 domain family protein 5